MLRKRCEQGASAHLHSQGPQPETNPLPTLPHYSNLLHECRSITLSQLVYTLLITTCTLQHVQVSDRLEALSSRWAARPAPAQSASFVVLQRQVRCIMQASMQDHAS